MPKTNKAINNINFEFWKILDSNVNVSSSRKHPRRSRDERKKLIKKGILEANVIHDPKSETFVLCVTSVQKGLKHEMHHLKKQIEKETYSRWNINVEVIKIKVEKLSPGVLWTYGGEW